MAVNGELGRNHIQLFADIFTDLDEIQAALTTGTAKRLMDLFNTGQVIR
jgi:hypothetical protein